MLKPASPEDPEAASSTAETVESHRIWLWQQFAARVTPSVQRVVEFAKRVPGFCELSQDDQLILIKVGFFEVWLSHISKMTSDTSMTFEDGTYITRQQLELMYEVGYDEIALSFSIATSPSLPLDNPNTNSLPVPSPNEFIQYAQAYQAQLDTF
jgi:nuclear receptor subfamily 1 group D protein 3